MQSLRPPPSLTRRTRVSNADKHPGLPDAPAKRRSHSEKLADDAQKMEHQLKQQNKSLLTLATIASAEEAMEKTQSAKRATKKGIRPTPTQRRANIKDSVAAASVPAEVPRKYFFSTLYDNENLLR